jgi:hypothetical protein
MQGCAPVSPDNRALMQCLVPAPYHESPVQMLQHTSFQRSHPGLQTVIQQQLQMAHDQIGAWSLLQQSTIVLQPGQPAVMWRSETPTLQFITSYDLHFHDSWSDTLGRAAAGVL